MIPVIESTVVNSSYNLLVNGSNSATANRTSAIDAPTITLITSAELLYLHPKYFKLRLWKM